MKPEFSKIDQTTCKPREAFGVRPYSGAFHSLPQTESGCKNTYRIASPNPHGKRNFAALGFVLLLFSLSIQGQQRDQTAPDSTAEASITKIAETPYAVLARDGNQKLWSKTTWESNSVTGNISIRTNSFVELATGASFWANGQWNDSNPTIQITKTGAEATNSQHRVRFLGNINTSKAITITLPEGDKYLASTPIGLSYFDYASGNSVLIAQLQNSAGQLLESGNQVLYPDSFTDISADLLYINTVSGFEQLVILREQPPSPAEWGLDPETTLLQVITEFINPPVPQITERRVPWGVDQHLDFGFTQMPRGYAFALGSETNTIVVTKQWLNLDGRQCLVESTPFSRIEPLLQELPAPTGQAKLQESPDSVLHKIAKGHLLPVRKFAKEKAPALRLASINHPKMGVAIDYTTATSQTNFTFQSDQTYYVSSNVTLSGTTIFEGGAVIKFTNSTGAKISLNTFSCKTGPYRPVILTSKDDNTAGNAITGSTGSPTNYQGATYLSGGGGNYSYMRFSYAGKGISGYVEKVNGGEVWHSQFYRCGTAIVSQGGAGDYHNLLFSRCGTAVDVSYLAFADLLRGEHITADQITTFYDPGTGYGAVLTNCIFTAVTNIGSMNSYYSCATNSSSAGFYQTVGAASYYLADGSTNRNAGLTNLNSSMLTDLKIKTTYPPLVSTSNNISVSTSYAPQAQRDTDIPDRGYHYDPLDWVFSGVTVSNASLTLSNGVAVGVYGSFGIQVLTNASILSTGSAIALNHIAHYNTVQEQSTTNWSDGSCWSVSFQTNAACQFYFTDWSILSQDGTHCNDNDAPIGELTNASAITFRDNSFHGGTFVALQIPINVTNSLFERVKFTLSNAKHSAERAKFINNLFFGGTLPCSSQTTSTNNFFDRTTISGGVGDYNGYITNFSRLTPNGAHDVILTNLLYQTGTLGRYYQPTNSGLADLGSVTNAGLLGLFHYTSTTNQVKDGSSRVDIGLHYVATDSDGIPIDTDSDGTPDYLEDANGNGTLNSGETDWTSPFDLGLRVLITRPKNNSIIP
jgi:hypothetical protein